MVSTYTIQQVWFHVFTFDAPPVSVVALVIQNRSLSLPSLSFSYFLFIQNFLSTSTLTLACLRSSTPFSVGLTTIRLCWGHVTELITSVTHKSYLIVEDELVRTSSSLSRVRRCRQVLACHSCEDTYQKIILRMIHFLYQQEKMDTELNLLLLCFCWFHHRDRSSRSFQKVGFFFVNLWSKGSSQNSARRGQTNELSYRGGGGESVYPLYQSKFKRFLLNKRF